MEAYLSGEKSFVKPHFPGDASIAASLNSLLQLQTFYREKTLQLFGFSLII
ncbi:MULTISPECIES: DUF5951 family protein [unclassified Citrobacter]|uniref:DUF5951 family protein n=1 Tax=unclassified Citrobacter TaxID=2644389 RepID=UPI00336A1A59